MRDSHSQEVQIYGDVICSQILQWDSDLLCLDWRDEMTWANSCECLQESVMFTPVYLVADHVEMDNASTID